jgi:lysophospholipid acyltransferase
MTAFDIAEKRPEAESNGNEKKNESVLSLWMYLSYLFFYPSVIVGPSFSFLEFAEFVNERGDFDARMDELEAESETQRSISGLTRAVLKHVSIALVCIPLFICSGKLCNAELVFTETPGVNPWGSAELLPWFEERSASSRALFLVAATWLYRMKYYFIWNLSFASFTTAGFGRRPVRNGGDKNGKENGNDAPVTSFVYDRGLNIDSLAIEVAMNMSDLLRPWNMQTSLWLKRCVFKKAVVAYGKTKATVLVRLFSAVWHGLLPGYYLFFGVIVLVDLAQGSCQKFVSPWFQRSDGKARYYFFCVASLVTTHVSFGLLSLPFQVLSIARSIALWKSIYFAPHLWLLATWLLVPVVVPRRKEKKDESTSNGAEEKKVR